MNPEYGSKEQDLSATIGNTERGKRVMKRGRRFLAFLLAALLAAGSLQAPAVSMMTAVPVFAADAAEAETAGTDADANADQDLGKTSSREDEENASAVGDSSLTDTADEAVADSADANEETSGQEPAEPTEEEWQEEEPAEADPAAGETQEGGFEMETGQEQEAESALSDEGRNGGETQTTEPAETSVNDTENGTVSDDLSAAQEAASETGTELTPEQIRAFQEKVRIWKDGNRISMVYASTEDIRLAYSIYPGVEDLAETLDDPLYSGVLGWDDESGLYYEAVDFDAVNEADAGRDLPQIDIRDIPVCVVIEDGLNHYVESVGAAPGGVEIESAELNDGNIDIAWDGGDADGYAVIVRGSGVDVYDSTSPEISVSASESEEYVIEVSAYAYDENAGIMQFGEAGSRELMLSEGSQNEANDETPTPDDAQTASAGESKNTDEAASKDPEEQEKVLTEPGNRKTVSSDAMMDAVESGTCGENLTWTLDSEGVLTISGTGEMKEFSFGESPWYASRSSIRTVIISKGVTTISRCAFINCSSLTNITIPEGVTSIGDSAFSSCLKLTGISIPEGVTRIESSTFSSCWSMKKISLPQSLRYIDSSAFYRASGPAVIDLPEGLETIAAYAFAYMEGLEEVSVPDSVGTLGNRAFYSCKNLKSVTLGKKISSIPEYTFCGDSALEKVTLPQNLKQIGAKAFYTCSSLSQIAIPDSVKQIDEYAFAYCSSLTEISLPASLDALGEGSFCGCTNLHTVIMPGRDFETGENIFAGCADTLQFLDRNGQTLTDVPAGEESPAASNNRNNQNYLVANSPRYSYLIDEGTRRLRVEFTDGALTREYFSEDGILLSRKSIPFELSIFGGFFAGKDSYFLVFGQNNVEEDDEKEVIRIVKYSRDWVRQGAASIRGENTTVPFDAGTVSLTETDGMLYMRTSHQMYRSLVDGLRHQANLTAVIRESDMTVSWIYSDVMNVSVGYVSHSFNQIMKTDGNDILAADHGDGHPRGIILFRYAGKAGTETLDRPENVIVFPIVGEYGENATGASLGALEASSSHYLVAGNSVLQDEDSYDTSSVRNIFVTATPKNNFTSSATEIHWLTSYTGKEKVSTPVMTALPDGRFLLMWTVDEVLNYCFLAADGSQDGAVFTGEGSLSDCAPYVKDNAVWWYVTKSSAPVYYSISLKAPYEVRVQNPGHTVVFDPAGGKLKNNELEVVHGSTYGDLPLPETRAGYEFLGWFTGKNYGTQITASSDVRVRPSETLYAHWLQHWSFSEETGTLRILKSGDMKDYSDEWSDLKDRVKQVEIEPGVTSIRHSAFYGFSSLESVSISDSVIYINDSAFRDCTSLRSITISASLTRIGDYTFKNCTSIKSITIPAGVTDIGDSTFEGCTALGNITIPFGVTRIGSCAFDGCTALESITIPSSVTNIERYAFEDCTALKSIIIPAGVTAIQNRTFSGCTALESITIPAGVTSIGYGAFSDCTALKSIKIPDAVTSIDGWAFSSCKGLTSLIIPGNVTQIGNYAFYYCSRLKYVTIPASVESIGNDAFLACPYNLKICGIPGSYAEQYANEKKISFRDVNKQYLEDATVTGIVEKTYTGNTITQVPTVKIGDVTLIFGKDYQLSYSNNTNAGTATVTITGIGNCEGTIARTFAINPASISTAIVTGLTGRTYNGFAQTQNLAVKVGGTSLKSGTDYTLSYANNTNVGTATVTIVGKANYTGNVSKTFTISAAPITNATVTGISNKTYTGQSIIQTPAVKIGEKTLVSGTDYRLSYSDNTNAGTATVTITGVGNYEGTIVKTFEVIPVSITNAIVTGLSDRTYNGSAQTQSLTVNVGGRTLNIGTDYRISYSDNINAGTATVTITGIGNYEGTTAKTFEINPISITNATVTGLSDRTYNGSAQTQNLTVKVAGTALKSGTDYTLSYSNNTNAGTATVTITGKGNYTGKVSKGFAINTLPISDATVTGISDKTYNGKAISQTPVVKIGDMTLVSGTDYQLSYSGITNIGTATVTITGIGNYQGSISKNFAISPATISTATVTGLSAKTYTGKAITQTPVVKVGDATLVSGTDYSLSYSNNTNAGTATVTITGKGNYTGTKTATFRINKAAQNISVKSTAASVAVGRAASVSITGNKGTKSYKSSNTAVATVTATGRVTARKVGTVKITATSAATANYNAASKTVTIKVVPAATASIAAANQATGIRLTWKRVAGAAGYKVYRGATMIRTIKSGATVTCTDTKANANGTKYIFKVIPYASTGNGLARSLTTYRVARPAVSSVKNSAAKKMTVKWGRNAKANGYQIQYSTSRTFASGNKAVIVAGAANVSRVIGGLVKGKTYYVRIRTYKTVGKARYWSIWSPAKSVKIAK